MKKFLLATAIALAFVPLFAQNAKQQYKVAVIGFYNLENFYDTLDNPMVSDEEFLPSGPRNYTGTVYKDKVLHLATVISEMATSINTDGPALLGVAEVENDTVLNDLVHHPLLLKRGYKIVHYDSKDARGVDVGMTHGGLDGAQVGLLVRQHGAKGVAQPMR